MNVTLYLGCVNARIHSNDFVIKFAWITLNAPEGEP